MRTRTTLAAVALVATGMIGWDAHADTKLTPAEAKAIAQEGYLFGLPPVYIALEAGVLTNVVKPGLDAHRSISSITTESSPTPRTTRSSG